ncbi:CNNM domain-containing protein, CBS domain-containing protein [[Mycoplasma] cavipharyngis]|uniref:CNNM domain-containing protein n=1 Tax=[Mycoplasma] cavipharyngis TaxID=92757 RepID=UPI00370448B9
MSDTIRIIIYVIVIILFIVASGFVSALETSCTAVNGVQWRLFLKKYENQKLKLSIKIVNLFLAHYAITSAMTLLINNVLAIAAATFSNNFLNEIIGNATTSSIISIILITFLLVFFGDFCPKNLVKVKSIQFLIKTSYVAFFLWLVCFPITYFFGLIFRNYKNSDQVSREMIDNLTDVAYEEKVIDQHEAELVSSALELDEKNVSNFMTHNAIFAYKNDTITDLLKIYYDHQYTRIIILDKHDQVYGTLNYKLLLKLLVNEDGSTKNINEIKISEAISETIFLVANTKLDDALRQMQKLHSHIAVVIAKPNSKKMLGVITIEDILEELVGEIHDENDDSQDILQINEIDWVIDQKCLAVNIIKSLKLANKINFVVHDKMRAHDFFIQYFKTPELKLNHIYQKENITLKVEQGLNSKKYKYFITQHEITENYHQKTKINFISFWKRKK